MFIKKAERPSLFSVEKIWDQATHCALTDLIRYRDAWYCAFRESNKHVYGTNGIIRIIVSQDGLVWATAATFHEEGVDLRDPKLSITPDGRLMLLVEGLSIPAKNMFPASREWLFQRMPSIGPSLH